MKESLGAKARGFREVFVPRMDDFALSRTSALRTLTWQDGWRSAPVCNQSPRARPWNVLRDAPRSARTGRVALFVARPDMPAGVVFLARLAVGAVSGGVASFCSCPIEVCLVRMQVSEAL